MRKTTLLLFDIDGTLLTSGGAGEHSLRHGFTHAFGIQDDLTGIEIAGRTDSGIARQLFAKHGLAVTPENLERFFSGYLHFLPQQLATRPGTLLPGVQLLLQHLATRKEVALGLLTGNLQRGAQIKLAHYGIAPFFEFGAFADDHHDRDQLGPFAKHRAQEHHRVEFASPSIFVLGDTPHDIRCARALGAVAVAVATGSFSKEQLAPHQPDVLLEDFSNLEAVTAALRLS
jgi:phosphoglycolate phosphatase